MNVCPSCFGHEGLGRRIAKVRAQIDAGPCDFHQTRKGVPVAEVARIVDPVFRAQYFGGPDDGNVWIDRGDLLEEALLDLTQADDDEVVRGLIQALEAGDDYNLRRGGEPFYDTEYRYTLNQNDMGPHGESWSDFRRSLMFDRRFFNSDAEALLFGIFSGVQQQRNVRGEGPVYRLSPGEPQARFYRARSANSWKEADVMRDDVAGKLGPPPETLRRAGRLNPSGILAFYAAFDVETCVAELRPPVGGSVASAQFELTAPIYVLDTTRFLEGPSAVNLFAPRSVERRRQFQFMQLFMQQIAQPVLPGDEHLEYLPTQAVAEFLNKRFVFDFDGAPRTIDAIIFRSAQHPSGKNIVLLGDAAVVGDAQGLVRHPTGEESIDEWLEFELWQAKSDRPARIVPVPDTFSWRKITGVDFAISRGSVDNEDED